MKKGESVTYEVVGGFKSKKESLTGDAFNCFRFALKHFVTISTVVAFTNLCVLLPTSEDVKV